MANAIASSSQAVKRSSPNTTGSSSAKRARQSSTKHDDFDDDEDIDEDGAELDQSAKAKAERKAARIIRNRESAQRSRNQRKQHLAWLESRVIELERENRALRSGDTPSLSSSSSARESSPSQSVASFASDLGIPPEVVNSSGGVNLANVAPPPSDLDVKPVVEQPFNTVEIVQTSDLEMENAALRERVSLLENLVKQVVALSNLGSVPPATSQSSLATPTTSANPAMDWEALNHLTVPSTRSGGVTLSPAMYHATPLTATSDDSMTNPTASLFDNESVHGQNSGLDLTCHPAAMVTSSLAEAALQRVRTPSVSVSLEMNSARLRTVARVVVALAKVKGSTKPTSPWNRQDHTRRSRWMSRCGARDQWATKTGMRG